MPQNCSLDQQTIDAIDAHVETAVARGWTRQTAIRWLVAQGVDLEVARRGEPLTEPGRAAAIRISIAGLPHPADCMTLLRSPLRIGGKAFSVKPDGTAAVEGYARAKHFAVEHVAVGDFDTLSATLRRLLDEPHVFVIRGEPVDGINLDRTRRLVAADPDTGHPPTFRDVPRRWLHIDIDRLNSNAGTDPIADPADAAQWALSVVATHAPELDGVSACWAYSSSAGVGGDLTVKLHLWFRLAEPATGEQLRRWGRRVNNSAVLAGIPRLIDASVFGAVQPNYCARPLFGAGLTDPFPGDRRFGFWRGHTDAATLDIPVSMPPRLGATGRPLEGIGAAGHLEAIGGPDGMRKPALSATAALVREFGTTWALRHRDDIVATVQAALRAANSGDRSPATVETYIAQVDDWFDWAIERQRSKIDWGPSERVQQLYAEKVDGQDGGATDGAEASARQGTANESTGGEAGPTDLWAARDQIGEPDLRGALPATLERFVFDAAPRLGIGPSGIALAAIVTCAAAVPESIQLQAKRQDDSWTEGARLWGVLVGPPSAKKTPAIKTAVAPLRELERQWAREHRERMAGYEAKQRMHEGLSKAERAAAVPPVKPVQPRVVVGDTTIEALSEILKATGHDELSGAPTGKVLVVADELAGLITRMDGYGNGGRTGADRPHYLELYNGGPHMVDRIGRGSMSMPSWSACIIGGIQPDVLRRGMADVQDGLLQRFLIVTPTTKSDIDTVPDHKAITDYADTLVRLTRLEPPSAGIPGGDDWRPGRVRFSHEAHAVRDDFFRDIRSRAVLAEASGDDALAAALAKWEGTFVRLALVFHAVENTAAVREGAVFRFREVNAETATMAARFLWALLPGFEAFYETLAGGDNRVLAEARAVAETILVEKRQQITARDAARAARRLVKDERLRGQVLDYLTMTSWLEPMPSPRRDSKVYAVNPLAHTRFADRVPAIAAIRDQMVARMAAEATLRRARAPGAA